MSKPWAKKRRKNKGETLKIEATAEVKRNKRQSVENIEKKRDRHI